MITYTDNTTATINPVIIGVYGDKGDKGNTGDKGADAYTVMLTNESHIFAGNISSAIASSATTQVLAYKGSTAQPVTIVSVDGKTASTSSTATSIIGLSFINPLSLSSKWFKFLYPTYLLIISITININKIHIGTGIKSKHTDKSLNNFKNWIYKVVNSKLQTKNK